MSDPLLVNPGAGRKHRFFEKRSPPRAAAKLLTLAYGCFISTAQRNKSFLRAFFSKKRYFLAATLLCAIIDRPDVLV
jgi:hypothetical protein